MRRGRAERESRQTKRDTSNKRREYCQKFVIHWPFNGTGDREKARGVGTLRLAVAVKHQEERQCNIEEERESSLFYTRQISYKRFDSLQYIFTTKWWSVRRENVSLKQKGVKGRSSSILSSHSPLSSCFAPLCSLGRPALRCSSGQICA